MPDVTIDYAMKYYVEPFYDKCNGSAHKIPKLETAHVLTATMYDFERSTQIAALWMWETGFQLYPQGDAGPAQLTTWWKRNHPELIVGNAYGSWNGRTDKSFNGNPLDNMMTLANIIEFSLKRYAYSFYKVAYWYGPGSKEHPRDVYAHRIINNYNSLKPFFDCLAQGK